MVEPLQQQISTQDKHVSKMAEPRKQVWRTCSLHKGRHKSNALEATPAAAKASAITDFPEKNSRHRG